MAYTLLTSKDSTFAGDLVRNLEGANQAVSKELMDLAMQVRTRLSGQRCWFWELQRLHGPLFSPQNPWFRKSRFKAGKGKRLNIGGGGLGYKERPGLGSESSVSCHFSVFSTLQMSNPRPRTPDEPCKFGFFCAGTQQQQRRRLFALQLRKLQQTDHRGSGGTCERHEASFPGRTLSAFASHVRRL